MLIGKYELWQNCFAKKSDWLINFDCSYVCEAYAEEE